MNDGRKGKKNLVVTDNLQNLVLNNDKNKKIIG
jgi:hypothetical protein